MSTSRVLADFEAALAKGAEFDVITFSGNGEPTLASNFADIASELKQRQPHTPLLMLTNATMLHLAEVRSGLNIFDRVIVKLDAPDEATLKLMNRPAQGVSMQLIRQGLEAFKQEFSGTLDVQMMFMPANIGQASLYVPLLKLIAPDHVHLNTPLRPYPLSWDRENRGNEVVADPNATRQLRVISRQEALELQELLHRETGLKIMSVYRE